MRNSKRVRDNMFGYVPPRLHFLQRDSHGTLHHGQSNHHSLQLLSKKKSCDWKFHRDQAVNTKKKVFYFSKTFDYLFGFYYRIVICMYRKARKWYFRPSPYVRLYSISICLVLSLSNVKINLLIWRSVERWLVLVIVPVLATPATSRSPTVTRPNPLQNS